MQLFQHSTQHVSKRQGTQAEGKARYLQKKEPHKNKANREYLDVNETHMYCFSYFIFLLPFDFVF